MRLTRKKLADVIDVMADYVEEIEGRKQASAQAARSQRIEKFAERYSYATGESLPDHVRKKLASMEPEELDVLMKVAKNTDESPDALGSPAETSDDAPPRTVKEAAHRAEDEFLGWILS